MFDTEVPGRPVEICCSTWSEGGAYTWSFRLARSAPPVMVSCRLWCSVFQGVQLTLPPPMKRESASGVAISAASANGLAVPNGLTGHVPAGVRVLSDRNAGVYEKTL